MANDKSFFEKYFLLLIYSVFLGLDCYFLYTRNYASRFYSKPILMVLLLLWFFIKTSFANKAILSNSYMICFYTYSILLLSLLSDICALWSDIFIWSVCRLLYIPIYMLYLLLLIEIQHKAEKKIIVHIKRAFPALGLMFLLAVAVLYKAVGFGTEYYHWCLYLHAFIICLIVPLTANMWGYRNLENCRILFAISIVFLVLTNITFCFDELYYNRVHRILDVFVALGNGATVILMLFGVMRLLTNKKKLK